MEFKITPPAPLYYPSVHYEPRKPKYRASLSTAHTRTPDTIDTAWLSGPNRAKGGHPFRQDGHTSLGLFHNHAAVLVH